MDKVVALVNSHPVLTMVGALSIVYFFLLPHVLWILRIVLLRLLSFRGFGKDVHLRNNATINVFVCLVDSQGFKQLSSPVKLVPGEEARLALDSWKGEPCVAWSEQISDLHKGGPTFRWRRVGVGLSHNFRDLAFIFRHPSVGGNRHLGSVEMITSFELSVLGRVDHVIAPYLETDKETLLSDTVEVEHCTTVCRAEKEWLRIRDEHTQKALVSLLGKSAEGKKIRVALFSSGGGVRAMVALMGALEGLETAGILPTVSYLGSCSGSCWGVAVLMRHLELQPDAPMADVISAARNDLRNCLAQALFPSLADSAKLVLRRAAVKIAQLESLSLVSVYGSILANAWPTSKKLSDQADVVMRGGCPLPLYAAGTIDFEKKEVVTAEFSPLNCYNLGVSIPASAVGRRFDRGKTDGAGKETEMDDLLGMFGSAFCTTVEKIAENALWVGTEGAASLKAFVRESAVDLAWTGLKTTIETVGIASRERALAIPMVYPLHLNNFAFDCESESHTPLTVPFFDAGIDCNLPWSVATRRDVDIIIALDHSDDIYGNEGFLTLQGLKKLRDKEMKEKGSSRFPEVSTKNMHSDSVRIFGSKDKGEIVVIYLPTKAFDVHQFQIEKEVRSGFCSVANFRYSNENFDKLANLGRDIVLHHAPVILEQMTKLTNS